MRSAWTVLVVILSAQLLTAQSHDPQFLEALRPAMQSQSPQCGYGDIATGRDDFVWRLSTGELPARSAPIVAGRSEWPAADGGAPTVTIADIFPYEDSESILMGDFSFDDLFVLMIDAANAVMIQTGDNYDFIGYWLDYEPDHTIGAAFYLGLENDVQGLGLDVFNIRPFIGLAGDNLAGMVMMWDVNTFYWAEGDGPEAGFTRLAMGQEFEHRFGMFLPELADGRVLQGDNDACGRQAHWNFKVDGQGSCMEIANWIGTNPADLTAASVSFNTDIADGVFSYADLYLMGYVSPAEMDAGQSELRYMNDSVDCSSGYAGVISDISAADFIEVAGERVPSHVQSQKGFRTAWVMLHLPGDPPTEPELAKAVGILNQMSADWEHSTLGRGVMDHSLAPSLPFTDLGAGLPGFLSPVLTGEGSLAADSLTCLHVDGALPGSPATLIVGLELANMPFFGGTLVPSADAVNPGLVTGPAGSVDVCGRWPDFIPSGMEVYFQVWVSDPGGPQGFSATNALRGMTAP